MESIQWIPGVQTSVDPNSTETYRIDCTNWLEGDTLSNATAFVVATGVTVTVTALESSAIEFTLSGMVVGAFTSITLRPVGQTSGRSDDFTIRIIVENK